MKIKVGKLYEDLCGSTNREVALISENNFLCYFSVRFLLIASIISSSGSYFFLNVELIDAVSNGINLIVFAFAIWAFSKAIRNETLKMYIFVILLSGVVIFSIARFFPLVGPVVWVASFVYGVLLLTYSRSSPIIIFSIANALANIYMWHHLEEFCNWDIYYPVQSVAFIMLFFAFILVFKVIKNRQQKIYERF